MISPSRGIRQVFESAKEKKEEESRRLCHRIFESPRYVFEP